MSPCSGTVYSICVSELCVSWCITALPQRPTTNQATEVGSRSHDLLTVASTNQSSALVNGQTSPAGWRCFFEISRWLPVCRCKQVLQTYRFDKPAGLSCLLNCSCDLEHMTCLALRHGRICDECVHWACHTLWQKTVTACPSNLMCSSLNRPFYLRRANCLAAVIRY